MKKQIIILLTLIILIFSWQFFLKTSIFKKIFLNYPENHISNFLDLNKNFFIEWKICWEIDKRIFKTNYEICTKKIYSGEKEKKYFEKHSDKNFFYSNILQKKFFSWEKIFVEWKILLSSSQYPEFNYWDSLRIFWKIKTPFEGEDFSYKNFLLMNWIYWVINHGKVNKILEKSFSEINNNKNINFLNKIKNFYELEKFNFFKKIFTFKEQFLEKINKIYPSPHSAFLSGLLIWDRKWLPDDVKSDFQKNWLAHIVAISWYNITIIIILISGIFFFLPRRIWIILSSISIIVFTIFVWASSAVIRASIMWILWLLALYHGREKNILILILLTILVMSMRNPMMLWWDVWFHLSILAVFGIVYLVKIFEKFTKNFKNYFWIKEVILMTVSASLMTFPIISYNFWMVSLISPIANLTVDPLIPLSMLFGFLSIIFPFYFLQQFFGFLTYSILDLALKLSHFFAWLDFSFVDYEIWIFWVLWYYLVLWIVFWKFKNEFE